MYKRIFSTILIIVCISSSIPLYSRIKYNRQNNLYYKENRYEIERVIKNFISNSYNVGISDIDTSMIDKSSKKYLEFFKIRNKHRNTYLEKNGRTKDSYRYKSGLNINVLKVSKTMAYASAVDSYSIEIVDEKKEATGVDSFDIVLKKSAGKWKIYACVREDLKGIDDFDKRVDIFDFVDVSKLDNHLEKSIKQNATKITK